MAAAIPPLHVPSGQKSTLPIFTPRKTQRQNPEEDRDFRRFCFSVLVLIGGSVTAVMSWTQLSTFRAAQPSLHFVEGTCRVTSVEHKAVTAKTSQPGAHRASASSASRLACKDEYLYTFQWLGPPELDAHAEHTASESIARTHGSACSTTDAPVPPTIGAASSHRCWASRKGSHEAIALYYPSCAESACFKLLTSPEAEFAELHPDPVNTLTVGLVAFCAAALYVCTKLLRASPAPPLTPRAKDPLGVLM